jgi:site-specific DNA recombinase
MATAIAAIYVRVSTPGQAEDGLGQEAQLDTCQRIAAEHGLNVADEHVIVEQASGEYLERTGLDRLRSLVRGRLIDAVVVYDQDRLSRNEIGTVVILAEARSNQVTIYTRTGPLDATREGDLVAYVKGYASALERDKIRQRTLDGKRMTAKQGALPVGTGAGLYGYDYAPRIRGEHKRQQARSINESEAETVRRMFGMALEGLGVNTIARALNAEGRTGKTGKPWHPWTVKNILRNPAYTGQTLYGREVTKLGPGGKVARSKRNPDEIITIEGFTPVIIDDATFERVQAHLNRPRTSGHALQPYLLSGMLRCGCGTGMVAHAMWHGQYRYYSCRGNGATATRPRTCWSKRTRMDGLDTRVMTAITNAVTNPEFLYQRVMAHAESAPATADLDTPRETKARIKELGSQEASLVAALKTAPSAAASLTLELESIAAEKNRLQRALTNVQASQGDWEPVKVNQDALKAFSQAMQARLQTMDTADQHRLLSLLGFEATVSDSGSVQASIGVPVTPGNYLPLHEHGHDNMDVVVGVDGLDDAGAG